MPAQPQPHPQGEIVVAVKSLLLHNRRALIMHRSNADRYGGGIWEFPGGKLEFGEGLQQAILREIQEETGLAATVQRLLYAASFQTGPARQIIILNYLCHTAQNDVVLSSEHQAFRWASRAEMRALLDADIQKNLDQFDVWGQLDIAPGPED